MQKISVIIPIYNVADYLPKCIESVINQTYKKLEIILVDDGSPDRCPEICDEYAKKDKRIKVIHKKNGGLSDARNAGLEIAKGEYISFIDSDDYINEHMYENMLSAIENVDADLCICGYDRVNDDGEIRSSSHFKNAVLSQNDAFEMLVQGNVYFIVAWNKLYKRIVFDKLLFRKGKIHEDEFIMHHVYGECNKIVKKKKAYYYYLVRETSITGVVKGNVKQLDYVESYLDRIDYFHDEGLEQFASRLLPITINLFITVRKRIGIEKQRHNCYSVKLKKEIKDRCNIIDISTLSFVDRIGIKVYCKSEMLYVAWNRFISFVRKIKG